MVLTITNIILTERGITTLSEFGYDSFMILTDSDNNTYMLRIESEYMYDAVHSFQIKCNSTSRFEQFKFDEIEYDVIFGYNIINEQNVLSSYYVM